MELQLSGQVALVVGGASGIGRAIAAEFLQEGADVAIADVSSQVEAIAADLPRGQQQRSVGLIVDVTDLQNVRQMAETVINELGRCDHVIHAAGCGSGQFGFPFWDVEPSVWSRVLEVNLIGAMHVAYSFASYLTAQRSGTMLFLSSVAGQIGSQTDPPYSAAKAGLINFAQCAAKDLAAFNVRVNCLCPGMIRTPLNRSVWQAWAAKQPPAEQMPYEQWAQEKIQKLVPLGRWQEPEDVAAMAVFLASDRAKNITGQTINVDGGFVMHW